MVVATWQVVYLIARGGKLGEHQAEYAQRADAATSSAGS